jgi:large subunit ribosomal protein L24
VKLRKGDEVIVIAGKDKGVKGKVSAVFPGTNKVIVDGVNRAKRHVVARGRNTKSDIIDKDMPIHASNLQLLHKGTRTRVGAKVGADGTKVRIAKKTGEIVKKTGKEVS